jgi:[protein-PII] uridylyltransferase
MFLHHGKRDAVSASALSEKILYLLWDAGFNVGHSNRSLSECLAQAKEDAITRNSLIDARCSGAARSCLKTWSSGSTRSF